MKKIALFALALPMAAQDWRPALPSPDQIKLVQEHEAMERRAHLQALCWHGHPDRKSPGHSLGCGQRGDVDTPERRRHLHRDPRRLDRALAGLI